MPDTPNDAAPTVVDTLKAEVVRARLALQGITAPETVAAVSRRMTVTSDGQVIGLDAEGRVGVGTGPGFHLSETDILAEAGETIAPTAQSNPFRKGSQYSVTEQMLLWRRDPELASRLAADAGMRLGGGAR